ELCASAGCSAGALVGGFIASGTPTERWARALSAIDRRTFWSPDSLPRILWKMLMQKGRGYSGLSTTRGAMRFARDNLAVTRFEECRYPFHALAVNLDSGSKMVFSEGELAPRITASAAMPILYEPVRIDGRYYCDGALIDFAPTDAICCRHHLDVVIVHHVSQQLSRQADLDSALRDSWAMLEIVNRLVFREKPWYLSGDPVTLQHCPCGCGAIIIAIQPELPVLPWPHTEGGMNIMHSARAQAISLLQPYLDAIRTDPRAKLVARAGKRETPGSGCGSRVDT
ncbi:MAG TPA: hypothetical protein ENK05_06420, partial [Gammaproteobacteria bacterium]|nr:hypothetical protein [Gammaproteobacteria bacterium]